MDDLTEGLGAPNVDGEAEYVPLEWFTQVHTSPECIIASETPVPIQVKTAESLRVAVEGSNKTL